MKRLAIILCALFPTLPTLLLAQQQAGPQMPETENFRLHVFGSEYSGPTNAFLKDVEQNADLKKRLSELDYSYLDGDNIDAKQNDAYRYILITGTKEFPIFIVSDLAGNVYKMGVGYESAEKSLAWLDVEDLASSGIAFRPGEFSDSKLRRMARKQKKIPFGIRLSNSPWGLGVESGIVFSNLTGSETFTGYKTGYYANLFAKRYLPWKMKVKAGFAFNSLGGKQIGSGGNMRLNYISLPVDVERTVFRPRLGIPGGADLCLGIGVYGSRLLSEKAPLDSATGFSKWDAGVRVRLVLQQGSFSLSAGWMRGLTDLLPGSGKAYNNAFQLGLAITLGD